MQIVYKKNNHLIKTDKENEDLSFSYNDSKSRITVTLKAKCDLVLDACYLVQPKKVNGDKNLYFFNGYQSWTDTKEFSFSHKEKDANKLPRLILKSFHLNKYGDSTFYEHSKNRLHGYDVFYTKGDNNCFLYNLNIKNAYLVFTLEKDREEINLKSDVKNIHLKKDEELIVFDFKYFSSYEEGIENFNIDFPLLNIEKIFGYTSWYNYYQNINEEIILRDLEGLNDKFNLFQIDDGYETAVGDWLSVNKEKFPNGLEGIVKKIHEKGLKAGLWLAPFVAQSSSNLLKEHPEYFKKDKKGDLVSCGVNWGGFYALDMLNQDALNYIRRCLEHYMNMGFDFFKLDFLYACNLDEYEGYSRSMIAEKSYEFLRNVLKDKLILGCGATLFNSKNRFDYLRVGADVSLKFDDSFLMRHMHRERPSTKHTLQNTIYRNFLDQRFFGNDPDVFLLRSDNIKLSNDQKEALLTINALFGSVLMCSDNVALYDEGKQELLDKSLNMFYNAKDKSFKKLDEDRIEIYYSLDEVNYSFIYNVNKGIIEKQI